MIKFPKIIGEVKPVPLESYSEIISNYKDGIKGLNGIKGLVQMGSFTAPGISDIDLVVVVSDNGPWPDWNEISLKNLTKDHKHKSILHHDIFVIPESIANHIEAFFYIDQQNVLFGERLGGDLKQESVDLYKKILSVEYAVHRMETLMSLLIRTELHLKECILFISTLRHSLSLAASTGLIQQQEADLEIASIEKLRRNVLAGGISVEELNIWPHKIVTILWRIIQYIGRELTDKVKTSFEKSYWSNDIKNSFIDCNSDIDPISAWELCYNKQKNSAMGKYIKVIPLPIEARAHIATYLTLDNLTGNYLRSHFPQVTGAKDSNKWLQELKSRRAELVCGHWQFIGKSGYFGCSGKGYIGFSMPRVLNWNSIVYNILRRAQTLKVVLAFQRMNHFHHFN